MTTQTAQPLPSVGFVAAAAPITTNRPRRSQPVPGDPAAAARKLQLSRQAEAGDWGNGLGERVQWMINQKQNSAMIRLDPPALGKLDVQVKIAEDATTITIQTQHAQTRDLIETASHRLRDFLQESGYQNVNVDVSQRQDQQQARAQGGSAQDDLKRRTDRKAAMTTSASSNATITSRATVCLIPSPDYPLMRPSGPFF